MKIGILTIASPDGGGTYQYTLSLLEALKLYSKKDEYIQIRHPDFPKLLDKDIVINKKNSILLKLKHLSHVYAGFFLGNPVPDIPAELLGIDLIISPTISLLPFHLQKPYIVTIHDFQQEYYPEFFTVRERISRKIVYKTGKFAKTVVVESNFVKKDVITFLGTNKSKIKILPSPPPSYLSTIKPEESKFRKTKEQYKLPDKYLFYPAQFWYHKNHINLLQALSYIRKNSEIISLVLVGSKKNNFENVMGKIEEFGIEGEVKYLGYVPDEDMPYLYKLATALVMPTLFESVSLPIWEAFCLGVPVVSSNVCALPEQVGDAGLLFDPNNPEDMAEKIYRVWTDENLRRELINRGYERVKDLTLENYAKQWEEVIEEAREKVK